MSMLKSSASAVAIVLVLGLTAGAAWAQTVRTSKHDLSSGGASQGGGTGATTEVCVFCHTPHGSATGVQAPLWNKVVDATGFTQYSSLGSATLDGSEASVGSVSLACLSCHDGTQAMDVVLNKPGSGGYNALGAEIDAVAVGQMVGVPAGAPLPNLGKDLQNDHPVSIEYAGGACTSATPGACAIGATSPDPDFTSPQFQTLNGQPAWWVDTAVGVAGTREKTDMILYTRNDFNGKGTQVGPSVECGSCHDPHNAATAVAGESPAFMRIANTSSNVCLACHNK